MIMNNRSPLVPLSANTMQSRRTVACDESEYSTVPCSQSLLDQPKTCYSSTTNPTKRKQISADSDDDVTPTKKTKPNQVSDDDIVTPSISIGPESSVSPTTNIPFQLLNISEISNPPQNTKNAAEKYYQPMVVKHWNDLETGIRKIKPHYKDWQEHVPPHIREQMVEMMIHIVHSYRLNRNTLHLAVYVMDCILSMYRVQKDRLKILIAASMHIASKYQETEPPRIENYAELLKCPLPKVEVVNMEAVLLNVLSFELCYPSSFQFLMAWIAYHEKANHHEFISMNCYLLEICLLDYEMLRYKSSTIAAAALTLSHDYLDLGEVNLDWYWQLSLELVSECVIALRRSAKRFCSHPHPKYIQTIYSDIRCHEVAKIVKSKVTISN